MVDPRCVLLVVFVSSTGQTVQGAIGTMEDWIKLNHILFSNYTKEIYPVYNFQDDLNIDISMFLLSILDFDEVTGVITLSAGFSIYWSDYRLKWTTDIYGGIGHIQVNSSKVWKPKIYVITSADDLSHVGSDEFELDISYLGRCDYVPGQLLKSVCTVDMSRFPLDTQVCKIRVALWRASPSLKLSFTKTEFVMDWYVSNGEWDIDKTDVSYYMGFGTPSNTLDFTLQISRRHIYFVVSMTIPVLLLCFLNPFVFLLPSSSGERISYTITMFLSLAVYMTLIEDILPKVSENMAGMSYFLLITLFYSGMLIVLTIFTLRCEDVTDVKEFPKWLRRLTSYMCNKKGNKVISDTILEVEDQGGAAMVDDSDVDENYLCVQHKEVMKVVDNSLFGFSFLVIIMMTVWFLCTYHS
ncbi:neuronal acetylcholine receptor subunit alpha-7-like [Ylistrum balloti]|uniref:neuronal acetylcholine receptor subunit alpha-7-like n=1 Tax=Ylistrum balloti TaxID=509963 RepID=UPI002905AB63|nr:neuronal acetylcholine receptor subunit alpha-7-like [Ylistrum balloti]